MAPEDENQYAEIRIILRGGKRVFTTSSSPKIRLMQETISYMAEVHVPVMVVTIVRAEPGFGGILAAQSAYF